MNGSLDDLDSNTRAMVMEFVGFLRLRLRVDLVDQVRMATVNLPGRAPVLLTGRITDVMRILDFISRCVPQIPIDEEIEGAGARFVNVMAALRYDWQERESRKGGEE